MTSGGGIVERIPERAVRWAGLMCDGVVVVVVLLLLLLPAMLTWRILSEIRGMTVVKMRCLERRRILAPLVGERISSSLRRTAKPRAAVVLVTSSEDKRRVRRVFRISVVVGARRRTRALESQKMVLITAGLSFWSSAPGGRSESNFSAAMFRSSLDRNLLTRRER